jgi:hypothetical protein
LFFYVYFVGIRQTLNPTKSRPVLYNRYTFYSPYTRMTEALTAGK